MSINCETVTSIDLDRLLDGQLLKLGFKEVGNHDGGMRRHTCLSDGVSSIWVNGNCLVLNLVADPRGSTAGVIQCISESLETKTVFESDPEFWGYATQEELEADRRARAVAQEEKLYQHILRYSAGLGHDYGPASTELKKLRIARELIDHDPSLTEPKNRSKLLERAEQAYRDSMVPRIPW